MKYSVIIPAYQAENTISRCLDSLLAGIRNDAEIIVVNDGSTDRTGEILRTYAAKTPRLRCFQQPNRGVSAARNLGLDNARGEYVMFVDSDDYVCPDYFSVIDASLTPSCDFFMFGKSISDGKSIHCCPLHSISTHCPGTTVRLLSGALIRQKLNAPFTKVFRRQILIDQGIRFDERLSIGEDKVFVVQYMIHAKSAMFIRQPLYIMSVENAMSLSRKKREDLCSHVLLEHRLLFEAVEQSAFRGMLRRAVGISYYRSAYTVIRELYKQDLSRQQRLRQIRQICRRYTTADICSHPGPRAWMLSLPIRLQMAGLIDFALRKKRMK